MDKYEPGVKLPPHVSPFESVEDEEEHVPEYARFLKGLQVRGWVPCSYTSGAAAAAAAAAAGTAITCATDSAAAYGGTIHVILLLQFKLLFVPSLSSSPSPLQSLILLLLLCFMLLLWLRQLLVPLFCYHYLLIQLISAFVDSQCIVAAICAAGCHEVGPRECCGR